LVDLVGRRVLDRSRHADVPVKILYLFGPFSDCSFRQSLFYLHDAATGAWLTVL
jgi:hypothetical protein